MFEKCKFDTLSEKFDIKKFDLFTVLQSESSSFGLTSRFLDITYKTFQGLI